MFGQDAEEQGMFYRGEIIMSEDTKVLLLIVCAVGTVGIGLYIGLCGLFVLAGN